MFNIAGIFKAYDIRGVYPKDLNEELAYKIGQAAAEFYKAKQIMVARDMRLTSPSISKALIKGLTDSGKDVVDIGLSSTPMFYFVMGKFKYKAGIMVTASHNPKEYIGMKFSKTGARAVNYATGLKKIEKLVIKNKFKLKNRGKVIKKNYLKQYTKHVLSFVKKIPKIKIIIDTGNGMVGHICKNVFKKLPLKIIKLNFKMDGNFPAHPSNPLLPGSTRQLEKAVIKNKANLGIIFDGDGDRVVFVDDKGKSILGSLMAALIADDFLKKGRQTFIHDAVSSKIIKETVGKRGKVVRVRVGYSYIQDAMIKNKAIFGAEVSGHYPYKKNYYCDSGIITALKVLEIIQYQKLSEILIAYEKYVNSGEMNYKVKDPDKIIKKIEKHFKTAKIDHLDGVTIIYKEWWMVVRKSQTEPLVRVRIEAVSRKVLQKVKADVNKLVKN